ncbi:MAG: glycogen/starch synthase [Kofleriaceae bacterium]
MITRTTRCGSRCCVEAALAAGPALLGRPLDVVHAHDWQGALAVVYAREAGLAAATMTTIHNLAYRGIFPKELVPALGLSWSVFTHRRAEFWDQLSLLKAGLADADVVTTVSPTYADEILTPARGEGLDQFLRHDVRALHGITNGIDAQAWDPATDPALPARYRRGDLAGKARCRHALATALGLTVDATTPIAATVARLTPQKGIDLIADQAGALVAAGARLAVLGTGDGELETRLAWLARAHPGAVAVRLGFEPDLARLLYAGADLFLMPSRFEPCGLGQQYAMRYGAVPVVAAVGGLVDTVVDAAAPDGTGFCFDVVDGPGLVWAVERAVAMFRAAPAQFAAVIDRGMARDASWAVPARAYLALYAAALRRRSP